MKVPVKRNWVMRSLWSAPEIQGVAEPIRPGAYWRRLDQEAVAVAGVGELVAERGLRRAPPGPLVLAVDAEIAVVGCRRR